MAPRPSPSQTRSRGKRKGRVPEEEKEEKHRDNSQNGRNPKSIHRTTTTRPKKEVLQDTKHSMPMPNGPKNMEAEQKGPIIPVINPIGIHSNNIIHRLHRYTTGQVSNCALKQAAAQSCAQQLSEFQVFQSASPFDRRVTAMEWHPRHPTMLAVGSKGGDLMLWDYSKGQGGWNVVQGIGAGGSVQALKFDLHDSSCIFTSSIDGMVSRLNFEGRPKKVYLQTGDWDFWYCSLDVNYTDNVLVAGDNIGKTVLMTRKGEELWSHRLHKQKVTHCEFNKQCPWLLATASTDRTVKLWDIRNISGKKSFIYELRHERPINSAYFSPDGTKLLTTDQHSEIRIYGGPVWDRLDRLIIHPHRFFQHLTPIKASWHPYQNILLVGRYPDKTLAGFEHDDVRSLDAYDANSGELVCRLMDPSARGIQSLNVFSPSGDAIATGMGYNILVWKNAAIRAEEGEEEREIMRRNGKAPPDDTDHSKKPTKRHRSNNRKLTEKLQSMKKAKGKS